MLFSSLSQIGSIIHMKRWNTTLVYRKSCWREVEKVFNLNYMISHTVMNLINLWKVFQWKCFCPMKISSRIGWNNATVASNFCSYKLWHTCDLFPFNLSWTNLLVCKSKLRLFFLANLFCFLQVAMWGYFNYLIWILK